jgi:hypothetical protein
MEECIMRKVLLVGLLALVCGLFSAPAVASDGSFQRGVAEGVSVRPLDINRATHLASKAVQDFARELLRAATYQSGCFGGGLDVSAGTGFDLEVAAGLCFQERASGTSYTSPYRVLHQVDDEDGVCGWAANPVPTGSVTYHVHVAHGSTVAGGVEAPTSVYLCSVNASESGYYRLASVLVTDSDTSAGDYSITDQRTVFTSTHYSGGAAAGHAPVADGASGVTWAAPTPATHAASHAAGATDEIEVVGLGSGISTAGQIVYSDALGGLAYGGMTSIDTTGATAGQIAYSDGAAGAAYGDIANISSGASTAGQIVYSDGATALAYGGLGDIAGNVEDLSTAGAIGLAPTSDGAGGLAMGTPTPAVHAASHGAGAADEIEVGDLGSGVATIGQVAIADGAGALAYGSAEDLASAALAGQGIVGDGAGGLAVGDVDGAYVSAGTTSDVDTLHGEVAAALTPAAPLVAETLPILDEAAGALEPVVGWPSGGRMIRLGAEAGAGATIVGAGAGVVFVEELGVASAAFGAPLLVVLPADPADPVTFEVTAPLAGPLYVPVGATDLVIEVASVAVPSATAIPVRLSAVVPGELCADFTAAGVAGARVVETSIAARNFPIPIPTVTP